MHSAMTIIGASMRNKGRRRGRATYDTEIRILMINGVKYRASPPLYATGKYDPRVRGFFIKFLVKDMIEISTFGRSWDEAEKELMEEFTMLWEEYAQEDPNKLSPKAKRLRTYLLDRLKPVDARPARVPANKADKEKPAFHAKVRLCLPHGGFDVHAENVAIAAEDVLESVIASGGIEIDVYDGTDRITYLRSVLSAGKYEMQEKQ